MYSTLHSRHVTDMVDRNTVIDSEDSDRTPQAAADSETWVTRLEKTTNSQSPQTQKLESGIQETSRDVRQTDKIYHFQNCGTVYMDSFNARGVRMENCGNNIPQVICSLIFSLSFVVI